MSDPSQTGPDMDIRPNEVAVRLPPATDAGVYFIGTIHTPWKTRAECPRRGADDGPLCSIMIDERWGQALTGIDRNARLQVLYWMNRSRRDLVIQSPRHSGLTLGTFALRSPVRPNPIASSVVVEPSSPPGAHSPARKPGVGLLVGVAFGCLLAGVLLAVVLMNVLQR